MTIELAALLALVYIGWSLERIVRAVKALEMELSTARWERGKRFSDMHAD